MFSIKTEQFNAFTRWKHFVTFLLVYRVINRRPLRFTFALRAENHSNLVYDVLFALWVSRRFLAFFYRNHGTSFPIRKRIWTRVTIDLKSRLKWSRNRNSAISRNYSIEKNDDISRIAKTHIHYDRSEFNCSLRSISVAQCDWNPCVLHAHGHLERGIC